MTDRSDHSRSPAPGSVCREGGKRVKVGPVRRTEPGSPLISIVTVVYNDREGLRQTIQSVLGQTYPNIEFIVIDGVSTDGTVDVLEKYNNSLDYWVSEQDRGLYDAMNKGIDLSQGEWINFMNAGDRFHDVDTVTNVIQGRCAGADVIYGHCQLIFNPGFSIIWRTSPVTELWKGMICRHQTLFTRSSLCKKFYFDLRYMIGADFAFIYACYQERSVFCDSGLVVASVMLGGLSDEKPVLAMRENRQAVIQYRNTVKVNLYYGAVIFLTTVKMHLKKIMPQALLRMIRVLKYR